MCTFTVYVLDPDPDFYLSIRFRIRLLHILQIRIRITDPGNPETPKLIRAEGTLVVE